MSPSPDSAPADRAWRISALLLFATVAAVAFATVTDYGLTWDEIFQVTYSEKIAAWFTSGFSDRGALDYNNLYAYGGFADLLGWIAGRLAGSPAGEPGGGPYYYEARHVVWIAFGLFGLAGTYRLAALVGGPRAGTLAMAALALTPLYYGHQFNNSKDIPFTALLVWTLYAIVAAAREVPQVSLRRALFAAVMMGLTLGVRVGGVFVFGYLGLLWAVTLGVRARREGRLPQAPEIGRLAGRLALMVVVAWLVMIAFWPWAQVAPFTHPFEAFGVASRFYFPYPQLFMGVSIRTDPPPLSYIPIWFGVVLPEYYAAGAAAGLVLAWRAWRRRSIQTPRALEIAFLLFTVVFPPLMVVALRSTLYDGVRHLMFVLPSLCVLIGVALAAWMDDERLPKMWKAVVVGLAAASALATVVELVRLHPYEMIYFNRFVGGLPGGAARFETDYWGLSYREGMEWLIRHPPIADRPLVVANCSSPFLSEYFLKKDPEAPRYLVHRDSSSTHDVLLAITRWGCDRTPGAVLHEVRREGVTLLKVIRRDPPAAGTADVRFIGREAIVPPVPRR